MRCDGFSPAPFPPRKPHAERLPHRRRLDHGQPHPGLGARPAARRPDGGRADAGRLPGGLPPAQPVPPAVRRGRVQLRLRAAVLRPARQRGPGGGTRLRPRSARRAAVLAALPDAGGRAVHAAAGPGDRPRLRRQLPARGVAGAHHLSLRAADLRRRPGVGRAERPGTLRRCRCRLCPVQRGRHRRHPVADAARAQRGICRRLGHHRVRRGAAGRADAGRRTGRHAARPAAPPPHAAHAPADAAHAARPGRQRHHPAQPRRRHRDRHPAARRQRVADVLRRPGEPASPRRARRRRRHHPAAGAGPPRAGRRRRAKPGAPRTPRSSTR